MTSLAEVRSLLLGLLHRTLIFIYSMKPLSRLTGLGQVLFSSPFFPFEDLFPIPVAFLLLLLSQMPPKFTVWNKL